VNRLLTPQEVAAQLRVHRATVHRLLERGELPGVRVASLWRIDPAALETYLQGTSNHTGPQPARRPA